MRLRRERPKGLIAERRVDDAEHHAAVERERRGHGDMIVPVNEIRGSIKGSTIQQGAVPTFAPPWDSSESISWSAYSEAMRCRK